MFNHETVLNICTACASIAIGLLIGFAIDDILNRSSRKMRSLYDNCSGYLVKYGKTGRPHTGVQPEINPANWANSLWISSVSTLFAIMLFGYYSHDWTMTLLVIALGAISWSLRLWYVCRIRHACRQFDVDQVTEQWQAYLGVYHSSLYLVAAISQIVFSVFTLIAMNLA